MICNVKKLCQSVIHSVTLKLLDLKRSFLWMPQNSFMQQNTSVTSYKMKTIQENTTTSTLTRSGGGGGGEVFGFFFSGFLNQTDSFSLCQRECSSQPATCANESSLLTAKPLRLWSTKPSGAIARIYSQLHERICSPDFPMITSWYYIFFFSFTWFPLSCLNSSAQAKGFVISMQLLHSAATAAGETPLK